MSELEELKLAYAECSRQRNELLNKLKSQAQQEPVAWMYQCSADSSGPVLMQHKKDWAESGSGLWTETPLYTSPPAQRTWVGLTDEDKHYLNDVLNLQGRFPVIDAIEAKLRSKNEDRN